MTAVLKHKRATFERIEKFISDIYFTDVNLYGRIDSEIAGLKLFRSSLKDQSYGSFEAMKKGQFSPISENETFMPLWSQHWIKLVVPADLLRSSNLHLHWDVDGAESLVCEESGALVQGMSCKRKEMKVSATSQDLDLVYYIQVSCTGLFGAGKGGMIMPPDQDRVYTLKKAHLFSRDQNKYNVFMDLSVLFDIVKEVPEDSSLHYDALYTGNEIVNIVTLGDHSSEAYKKAHSIGRKFLAEQPENGSRDTIHAIGNCHIDSAWLWPYRETIRKVARSWSTTLSMFDKGESFHFAGSQVVQFDWLKEHYPKFFERLRRSVKEKSFIPVGGTWVEMDTNIPSGEAMIRQFLYGQKFYRKEFGIESDILWLPDTFGYSGQLPQIMQLCGVKYFLSQKLSWNLTNTFPHHTFYWKGIDQSKVLAHFPPGDTYESALKMKDIVKTVSNNKDKGRTHDQMLLFGHGDGGGGPTPDMLERLNRVSGIRGLPKIKRSTPNQFFSAIEKSGTMLCEWWGELYFELHRGTYTSHSKLKELNRRCEFLMREIEFLSAHDPNDTISRETIEEMWKIVLFNQFHDILPGSSIQKVFDDAMVYYERFLELWRIQYDKYCVEGQNNCVINPYNWSRKEVVSIKEKSTLVSVPALYAGPPTIATTKDKCSVLELKDGIRISNNQISADFTHRGELRSLVHKARECIASGTHANKYVIFDDIPLYWDAWDVMEYHREAGQEFPPQSLQVLEEGPLRSQLLIIVPLGSHGDLKVFVSLEAESPYLAFKCQVDWRAAHKFLKVEFPLSISATDAVYEIQCGYVKRPTHTNTSWDTAKFEVSGHHWAHLSEPDFGVGLISKSKYGYSALHNQLTLSLLRSTKAPDQTADIGEHTMEYAVYPHTGPLHTSSLVELALNFNHPLVPRRAHGQCSGLRVDGQGIVVQSVKKAEDGRGTVIRMYEAYGNTCEATLERESMKMAFSMNAVESESTKISLPVSNNQIVLKFRPFEIKTVYIESEAETGHTRKASAASTSMVSPTKKPKHR